MKDLYKQILLFLITTLIPSAFSASTDNKDRNWNLVIGWDKYQSSSFDDIQKRRNDNFASNPRLKTISDIADFDAYWGFGYNWSSGKGFSMDTVLRASYYQDEKTKSIDDDNWDPYQRFLWINPKKMKIENTLHIYTVEFTESFGYIIMCGKSFGIKPHLNGPLWICLDKRVLEI